MKSGTLSQRQPLLTRQQLVNSHRQSFADRLRAAQAIDLRDNHRVVQLRGGYDRVVAVDLARFLK